MKKLYIRILLMFFPFFLAAQTVEFTNKFFAASFGNDMYMAFVYGDKLEIMKRDGRGALVQVRLDYRAVGSSREIVVIKDELLLYDRAKNISVYDLNILTAPENHGKTLEYRTGRIKVIEHIQSITSMEDSLYFIKDKDSSLYEYTGRGNASAVQDVLLRNATGAAKYLLYYPFAAERRNRYRRLEQNFGGIVGRYMDSSLPSIEKELEGLADEKKKNSYLYGIVTDKLKNASESDKRTFTDYVIVSNLLGETSYLARLNPLRQPDLKSVQTASEISIRDYYEQTAAIYNFTNNEQKRRNDKIQADYAAGIASKNRDMKNQYGESFDSLNREINELDKRLQLKNWIGSNGTVTEYRSNKDRIGGYDTELVSLSESSRFLTNEYRDLCGLFTFFSGENESDYSGKIISGIIDLGRAVSGLQNKAKDEYIKSRINAKPSVSPKSLAEFNRDYENYKTEKAKLEKNRDDALRSVDADIRNDINAAGRKKASDVEAINNYIRKQYLNDAYEEFSRIVSNNKMSDYSPRLQNVTVVSPEERVLFGFSIKDRIDFDKVNIPVNNNNRQPIFSTPSLYSVLARNKTMAALVAEPKKLKFYIIDGNNIANLNKSFDITVNEELFYILSGPDCIYYVTRTGNVHRLRPAGSSFEDSVLRELKLGDNDALVISSSGGTVISSDGKVNGRDSGNVTLNARNVPSRTVTVKIADKQITWER
ncbi:MAG: hypothetical protein LBE10_11495 [Treponema sp.]|jgi:hypothetical protein|nr:hypothetical protein [Treponema sp.]